ncbi:imidazole glycerol phosphate synthase subunit HisH [Homoserinibacter sp. YIM 151385]|uniref:imidazole glycerol phosphate synthase subunit HisH n=1 Tax=Homoserinibacter sp. YIM 151385 TaxID=2985506 RepID=UPI0022F07BA1|nr:imidazole glycerol phosphate synthase subunit HisH [Homoserinibacter sp. YIM 151385]WBU38883.1 imidazole glycerol phosphate synthase subunit HisH [Homoserinibacter sp. YIM 151385]
MSARPSVVVLDYGSGNIHSAAKAIELAGAEVEVTRDRAAVMAADGLFVPGVGAFEAVVTALEAVRGGELIERRLAGGRAVMGVCVGMQVMFEGSTERGATTAGLGEWPGEVRELRAPVLPHMGWNSVAPDPASALFADLAEERFYFVHSYAATDWSLEVMPPFPEPRLTWAEHGERFLAAVENGPLSATQFHPEKSGEAGIRLLANWLGTL